MRALIESAIELCLLAMFVCFVGLVADTVEHHHQPIKFANRIEIAK